MDKPDELNGNFCRGRKYGRIDLNGNGIGAPRRKLLKSSPIGGGDVRIGIEPSSPNSSSEEMERDRTGLSPGKSIDKKAKRMFFCFDQFGNVEFTLNFMRRFHWISQVFFNVRNKYHCRHLDDLFLRFHFILLLFFYNLPKQSNNNTRSSMFT